MRLNKNNWKILLFLFFVGIVGIILYRIEDIEGFVTTRLPKKIWTYWDTPNLPKSVHMCIESWKKYAPNYTIHILTKATLSDYVNIPTFILNHPNFNDSAARFSDLIRLYLLEKYGGIWMDASILLSVPIEEWLVLENHELFAYYNKKHTINIPPIIESWFLAAIPNSPFISAWKTEFINMAQYSSVHDYVQSRKNMGVNVKSLDDIHYTEYLAIYVACAKILQVDKYPITHLKLLVAEDGPYKYNQTSWNPTVTMPALCKSKELRYPMVKFTKVERSTLEEHLHGLLSNETCQWI